MPVSDTLVQHLCHKIFIGSPDGKKLLQLMKEWHAVSPVFPCPTEIQERHGGPLGWSGFRAGQLDFLLRLEAMANEFEQRVTAQNSSDFNKKK